MGVRVCVVVFALCASLALASKFPEIYSLSPRSGPMSGGTEITVTGANLALVTHCGFGPLNDLTAVEVESQPRDGKTVTCVVPAAAEAGPVRVSVSEDDGETWEPLYRQQFFVRYAAPVMLSAAPTAGPSTGSTEVKLAIQGFNASMDTDRAACMFTTDPREIVPMKKLQCLPPAPFQSTSICHVSCVTPQICSESDPIHQERCKQQTVKVLVSLNGQDFHRNPSGHDDVLFTFQNEWIRP